MGRLLLNSRGLNTRLGCQQILECIRDEKLEEKRMFIVSYTPYGVDDLIVSNCIEKRKFVSVRKWDSGRCDTGLHICDGREHV